MTSVQTQIDQTHLVACETGQRSYIDPQTGYMVFTAVALREKGRCCGCGCRHCPFGHERVPQETLIDLLTDPWIARLDLLTSRDCDVIFWSGGKDAYLALKGLQAEGQRDIVLLTTYDGHTNRLAHHDIELDRVRHQSRRLGLAHVLVPIFNDVNYLDRVLIALRHLMVTARVRRLVFGDLHLRPVRDWRVQNLGSRVEPYGIELFFPLWRRPYSDLMRVLDSEGPSFRISAINHPSLKGRVELGDTFDQDLVSRLPVDVDSFGENGEFHTEVVWPNERTEDINQGF